MLKIATLYADLSIIGTNLKFSKSCFSLFLTQLFFRDAAPGGYDSANDRENCELSDRDTRDMEVNNPQYFDNNGNYDFYERGLDRQGLDGDCLDGKIPYY